MKLELETIVKEKKIMTKENVAPQIREVVTKEIDSATSSMKPPLSPDSQIRNSVSRMKQEMEEKKKRENNLIFHGVADNKKTNDEMTAGDTDFILNLVQNTEKIDITAQDIKTTRRLGRIPIDDKCRPILVEFTTHKKRDEVLDKARLLKESEHDSVVIKRDMTPLERQHFAKLVSQAKELENNDPDSKNYIHRVRGPPWDFVIMRLHKGKGKENPPKVVFRANQRPISKK